MTTKKHVLQEIIENSEYEPQAYSGRAMYGKKCLGAVLDDNNLSKFISSVFSALADYPEEFLYDFIIELQKDFRSMSTDSMGMGTIVYWQNVPFVENDSEPEESAED